MAPSFSAQEVERYARQLVLREIGAPGQQALNIIAGVGGVGSPATLYLAADAVGRLELLDLLCWRTTTVPAPPRADGPACSRKHSQTRQPSTRPLVFTDSLS